MLGALGASSSRAASPRRSARSSSTAFDEEVARAYGHRVGRADDALLLVLLAVTVVIGVRLVGVLLVEALLVIPAATAALWADALPRAASRSRSRLGAGAGASASPWRTGSTSRSGAIVLVAVIGFFVSLALRRS